MGKVMKVKQQRHQQIYNVSNNFANVLNDHNDKLNLRKLEIYFMFNNLCKRKTLFISTLFMTIVALSDFLQKQVKQ